MSKQKYIYKFTDEASIDEVNDLLYLAALAIESLYGRSSLRLEGTFLLEKEKRRCVVSANTRVGKDLARVFTGYLGHHIGEKAFRVWHESTPEPAREMGGDK